MDNASTIVALIILVPISYWVYKDAESRGMNAPLWTAFVILMLIIGLPTYLIMRKPKIDKDQTP
jgi:hypothetical protein